MADPGPATATAIAPDHPCSPDRGYAVLFGQLSRLDRFRQSLRPLRSEKEHAAKMHDDLIDMVEWAISAKASLSATRSPFSGASVRRPLPRSSARTFTPGVSAAALPVVGITNLQTLLKSMPPYWAGLCRVHVSQLRRSAHSRGGAPCWPSAHPSTRSTALRSRC